MRPHITVCMATYNGSRFLKAQVDSILEQLQENDELLVVDDCSTDHSVEILKGYNDPRIRIIPLTVNGGHVQSFAKAMQMARHDHILLSDQDDLWLPGRLSFLISTLTKDHSVWLLTSLFDHIDQTGNKLPDPQFLDIKNHLFPYFFNVLGIFLGRRTYYGCTMALHADLLKIALPIPGFVECHDLWLAFVANLLGKHAHLTQHTLSRRIHSNNLTPHTTRNILKIIKSRYIFLLSVIVIVFRIIRSRLQ